MKQCRFTYTSGGGSFINQEYGAKLSKLKGSSYNLPADEVGSFPDVVEENDLVEAERQTRIQVVSSETNTKAEKR